jgi:predicted CxxxxCH...CXXCH cytochrome family protein
VLAACFSPSQEQKELVSFDDNASVAPMAPSDAGGTTVGVIGESSMDGSLPTPTTAAKDAAPNAPMAAPDAAALAPLAPVAKPDAGEDSGVGTLLFPIRCKAPWEDPTKYHPAGYGAANVHGIESNLNKDNCLSCHGDKLDGCANSPSCDNCHDGGHATNWRKDCVYCHGGGDNKLGAPPRDMDGKSDKMSLSFLAHTIHVTKERHKAYDCDTCHKKYEDALDPGHMYDDTPEKAEVMFDGGLSKDGMYLGNGSCANLYCHGDGKTRKASKHTDGMQTCKSCHSDAPTTGQHGTHSFGFDCAECHGLTVDTALTIKGPDYHVNGKVDLSMPENNMQWNGSSCTGTCHLVVYHAGDKW